MREMRIVTRMGRDPRRLGNAANHISVRKVDVIDGEEPNVS